MAMQMLGWTRILEYARMNVYGFRLSFVFEILDFFY